MPTIKDALDIIGKLTVAEQESLKTGYFAQSDPVKRSFYISDSLG